MRFPALLIVFLLPAIGTGETNENFPSNADFGKLTKGSYIGKVKLWQPLASTLPISASTALRRRLTAKPEAEHSTLASPVYEEENNKIQLEAHQDSAFSNLVDSFVHWLDAKDLPSSFLYGVQRITPAIDTTPGLNTVTKWLQALPPEVKEELISVFPTTVEFPTTRFWKAVDDRWQDFRQRAHRAYEALDESGSLEKFRAAAKHYNEVMEWTVDLPFAIYDARVEGFRNITRPLYDVRTEWLRQRDAVLESGLRRQRQTWEPLLNATEFIGTRLLDGRKQIATNALMLDKISEGLYSLRSLLWRVGTDARYAKQAALMCALNPVCCEEPSRCVPVELHNRLNA